ncbi:MAG: hypothetical protein RL017_612, partial [Pseudomonadota bacterium]
GLNINEFGLNRIQLTHQELLEERNSITHLLGK